MGLYLDYDQFCEVRDKPFTNGTDGYSGKGAQFKSVHSANRYCQAVRDEEGAHWQWPAELPIFWNRPSPSA